MEAAIIGNGMIGNATGVAFGIKKRYDLDPERSTCTLKEAAECDYVFICVPTPTIDSHCDLSLVEQVIGEIEKLGQPIYILRSTVLPGTADRLMTQLGIDRIVSNPEFLSENTWENDIKNPDLIVIGGRDKYLKQVEGVYRGRYKGVNTFLTDNITAEMIKYAINVFFATKVTYANKIYDLCQKVGVNYETLKNALYSNRNIAKNHLTIFYKGGRGVRGRCLPKDLEAFTTWSEDPFFENILLASRTVLQENLND